MGGTVRLRQKLSTATQSIRGPKPPLNARYVVIDESASAPDAVSQPLRRRLSALETADQPPPLLTLPTEILQMIIAQVDRFSGPASSIVISISSRYHDLISLSDTALTLRREIIAYFIRQADPWDGQTWRFSYSLFGRVSDWAVVQQTLVRTLVQRPEERKWPEWEWSHPRWAVEVSDQSAWKSPSRYQGSRCNTHPKAHRPTCPSRIWEFRDCQCPMLRTPTWRQRVVRRLMLRPGE